MTIKYPLSGWLLVLSAALAAQSPHVTIRVGSLLDGKGGVVRNATITVSGDKIVEVGTGTGAATYDLRTLTAMPGLIDTHVHLAWHFGPDGRYTQRDASLAQTMA